MDYRQGVSVGFLWLRTYTTICLRPRRGFRMNLRVRSVISDIFADLARTDSFREEGRCNERGCWFLLEFSVCVWILP